MLVRKGLERKISLAKFSGTAFKGCPKCYHLSTTATRQCRRRASFPEPRKSVPKCLPSADDSQFGAGGETDPHVVEVEDEVVQVSAEDTEEDNARTRYPMASDPSASR